MGLAAGIVGLPNVGKSTLFNAITNSRVEAANYPFATIEPNVGVVSIADPRLDFIAKIAGSAKIIPAAFKFVDIAGLVKGASAGEGLGNAFLSHIREVDAICHVVRCFDDSEIIHVSGAINPIADIETINVELIIADLQTLEKHKARLNAKIVQNQFSPHLDIPELLLLLINTLSSTKPIRSLQLTEEQLAYVNSLNLITSKPIIYVANMAESDFSAYEDNVNFRLVKEYADKEEAPVVAVSAKIESELATLDYEDRKEFMTNLGIKLSGLERLTIAAYDILGLQTFFTMGPQEARAWTFQKGMKAPQCAGVIHSDFEKGFIKAEVYSYSDLEKCGSVNGLQAAGRLRMEGKEYVMSDGDICHFRFNITK